MDDARFDRDEMIGSSFIESSNQLPFLMRDWHLCLIAIRKGLRIGNDWFDQTEIETSHVFQKGLFQVL